MARCGRRRGFCGRRRGLWLSGSLRNGRVRQPALGLFCGNPLFQLGLGAGNPLQQFPVGSKKTGLLVEIAADDCNGGHAVGEQGQVAGAKADATVEGLAQPVVQRFGQTDSVPRLGHFRAARQRMAGAIDGFGNDMRWRERADLRQPCAHGGDMTVGFARVDVAQRGVGVRDRFRLRPGIPALDGRRPGFGKATSQGHIDAAPGRQRMGAGGKAREIAGRRRRRYPGAR